MSSSTTTSSSSSSSSTAAAKGLSKHILGLKFMQRAEAEAQEAEVAQATAKASAPSIQSSRGPRIQVVSSFDSIDEHADVGRMSFRGFNEDVQRVMREAKQKKTKARGEEDTSEKDDNPRKTAKFITREDADISEEAAAKRFADFIRSSERANKGRAQAAEQEQHAQQQRDEKQSSKRTTSRSRKHKAKRKQEGSSAAEGEEEQAGRR
ncbi:hypothetical protein PTSG_08620 [Salpingoeca rosetta]|uniref:Uncharacterized protein n=1 Tax=Salpingoeca rosetta (strain ATCC 50818 / BSB-021) TaxID=946362 RepID=F2UK73_SALR5|nr:uncharacterized protein PTSG_08620 [Salpingoeca rosetta]EGD77522.1 hypothetical protein PTSG_08620 [Salpingoeca rosetta]|eukprot:XP_004990410.1 hypothetical protein PTSG_08620 [Salpingoeca rosetta]